MKSYIIHFIRHGSIDDTLAGKYIGTTDAPLSDRGRMDLKKLDYEYKYPGTQVVFTSPLKRCTETAKITLSRTKYRLLSTTFPNVISVGMGRGEN